MFGWGRWLWLCLSLNVEFMNGSKILLGHLFANCYLQRKVFVTDIITVIACGLETEKSKMKMPADLITGEDLNPHRWPCLAVLSHSFEATFWDLL